MDATTELLHNNEAYANGFEHGDLAAPPQRKVALVTCMDARIDPARVLGLEPGDAHVIRNAGGVVTDDALRSLSISQHHLGTEEILVIQHTRCGMMTFTDDDFAGELERLTGSRPPWHSHAFTELEESVREGVRRVRADPFIPRTDQVRGFVYEVESGRLREVAAAHSEA
jgi:carbonic anhydrase